MEEPASHPSAGIPIVCDVLLLYDLLPPPFLAQGLMVQISPDST